MRHACFLPAALALLLSPLCFSAADDWSVTPAARDGSSTANSRVLVIPNIIRKQTGYLTVTNNSCDHFAIVAAGSPSNPCGGITVSNFARHNRCRSPRRPHACCLTRTFLPPDAWLQSTVAILDGRRVGTLLWTSAAPAASLCATAQRGPQTRHPSQCSP